MAVKKITHKAAVYRIKRRNDGPAYSSRAVGEIEGGDNHMIVQSDDSCTKRSFLDQEESVAL